MWQQSSTLLALLLAVAVSYGQCAIDHEVFLNRHNVTEFVIDQGRIFSLTNTIAKDPATAPKLRFSLSNTQVDSVEHIYKTTVTSELWRLNLIDGSKLVIEVLHNPSTVPVAEYHVQWMHFGTEGDPKREVCFHYGHNDASWYNTYQSRTPSWPMDTTRTTPLEQFGYLHSPEATAPKEISKISEYLFVNSDGFAVLLGQEYPWFIRRDPGVKDKDPVMCFSNSFTTPYDPSIVLSFDHNFRFFILAGSSMPAVTEHAHHLHYMQPPTITPYANLFGSPIYIAPPQDAKTPKTEDVVLGFVDKLVAAGFPKSGDIILDQNWHVAGDYLFDAKQYPDVEGLVNKIHSAGFRVGLQVSGHLPRSSKLTDQFYIHNAKDNQSTGVLDFSLRETQKYFEVQLEKLSMEEKIDTILGQFFEVPDGFHLHANQERRFPGFLTKRYISSLEKVFQTGSTQVIADMAFNSQIKTVFSRLHNSFRGQTIDAMLASLIPNILSVSLGGYSFLIPYTIGGTALYPSNPTAEQYIRWVQASALLPRLAIATPPWDLGFNQSITDLTKKFITLHTEHSKLFADLAKERVKSGAPLVRPMWYGAPADPAARKISDQFMVGADLVVAPVLKEGVRERAVYLPTGTWVDQHGAQHSGPGSVTVKVPLEELAYFHRKK